MKTRFHLVPVGARFTFQGATFTKMDSSIGQDASGTEFVLGADYIVECETVNPEEKGGLPKRNGLGE